MGSGLIPRERTGGAVESPSHGPVRPARWKATKPMARKRAKNTATPNPASMTPAGINPATRSNREEDQQLCGWHLNGDRYDTDNGKLVLTRLQTIVDRPGAKDRLLAAIKAYSVIDSEHLAQENRYWDWAEAAKELPPGTLPEFRAPARSLPVWQQLPDSQVWTTMLFEQQVALAAWVMIRYAGACGCAFAKDLMPAIQPAKPATADSRLYLTFGIASALLMKLDEATKPEILRPRLERLTASVRRLLKDPPTPPDSIDDDAMSQFLRQVQIWTRDLARDCAPLIPPELQEAASTPSSVALDHHFREPDDLTAARAILTLHRLLVKREAPSTDPHAKLEWALAALDEEHRHAGFGGYCTIGEHQGASAPCVVGYKRLEADRLDPLGKVIARRGEPSAELSIPLALVVRLASRCASRILETHTPPASPVTEIPLEAIELADQRAADKAVQSVGAGGAKRDPMPLTKRAVVQMLKQVAETDQEVLQLHRLGKTLNQIVEVLKKGGRPLSRSTVHRIIQADGEPVPPGGVPRRGTVEENLTIQERPGNRRISREK